MKCDWLLITKPIHPEPNKLSKINRKIKAFYNKKQEINKITQSNMNLFIL